MDRPSRFNFILGHNRRGGHTNKYTGLFCSLFAFRIPSVVKITSSPTSFIISLVLIIIMYIVVSDNLQLSYTFYYIEGRFFCSLIYIG